MPLSLTQTVAPTAEPVTLAEVKRHARIDIDVEDADIVHRWIPDARRYIEDRTNRQIVTATWALNLNGFPAEIELPKPPLQSVTTITYIDADGAQRTLAADQYEVDTSTEPGRVWPAYGVTWPAVRNQRNAVTVTYVAGYGAPSAVPANFKRMILLLCGQANEHREPVSPEHLRTVPMALESMISMATVPVLA